MRHDPHDPRRNGKHTKNGNGNGNTSRLPIDAVLRAGEMLRALRAFKRGDFSVRLPLEHHGVAHENRRPA